MKQPRVHFINRFYWPEEPATAQLLTDLTAKLAAQGHAITVVTSHPGAPCPATAKRDGVDIVRVRSTRWGKRHLVGRLCDFFSFYPGALFHLLRTVRPRDMVVALTDPPLIGVVVGLAARWRRARLIHWVQDIYPEVAVAVGGPRWPLLLRPLRNRAWRHAEACVVPGSDMARLVGEAAVAPSRITISPNWAPAGVNPPTPAAVAALRQQWQLADKFVVAYSGNLGRVHDLGPIIETAAQLQHDPTIVFLFIGHGARLAETEQATRARGLANVRFLPPQPRDQLSASLGVGDVHLVSLLEGAERCVFPSKVYGIAQVGRPVVFIGARESELATLIAQHDFGAAFSRTEPARIAAYLTALKHEPDRRHQVGQRARSFAATTFADALLVWDQLLRTTPPLASSDEDQSAA